MRSSTLKRVVLGSVQMAFRVFTAPWALFYLIMGRSDNSFQSIMQAACLVPATPGVFVRHALLSWMAARCGRRVTVHIGTIFSSPLVAIGENVYIGAFCNVGYARIGDNVLLGSSVHLLSGKHQHGHQRTDVPMALQKGEKSAIQVGAGAWIGNGAIVMADVGEESIIGAGAVVVDAIPPWSIAVGSPARVVADRRASIQV